MAAHKGLNVLSLFDGISCGQQALKELGIPINLYLASEIHFPSIKVTQRRHPGTVQLGDVKHISNYVKKHKIDLILAGSPCQGFSFTGKQLNFKDPRSRLFFEFIKQLNLCRKNNPKVKFLLENVRMQKESWAVFDKQTKIKGVMINSRLFGCQNRPRIYWTNIKYNALPTKDHKQMFGDVLNKPLYKGKLKQKKRLTNVRGWAEQTTVYDTGGKCGCLTLGGLAILAPTSWKTARKCTAVEWERVQGLPDNYTGNLGISDTGRKKCIGNGWHVPTIKHLLKSLKK